MTARARTIVPIAALCAILAACGSSKAPGIVAAPSGGPTATVPATTSTTTSATTSTAATPLPPALSKKPVVVVPKGPAPKKLVIKDLIVGTGPVATPGSTVTVNYVGVLYKNGKEFDSSWKRNQPFTTPLSGGVITGWEEGIPGMRVGGRRMLIIPPDLAYKNVAQPGIPANSTLVFVVDLRSIA
jgi:FKBP-type peptidyl-prolyl cis-trans isomerase